jgi:hypothetical protein
MPIAVMESQLGLCAIQTLEVPWQFAVPLVRVDPGGVPSALDITAPSRSLLLPTGVLWKPL